MSVTKPVVILSHKDSTTYEGWDLCGRSEPYHKYNSKHSVDYFNTGIKCELCKKFDCGTIRYFGCCGIGKAVKISCDRLKCRVCKGSTVMNRSNRITERLNEMVNRRTNLKNQMYARNKFIHMVVSPPPDTKESFKVLRSKAVKSLRYVGMIGGVIIVHTLRCRDSPREKDGIHFHAVGIGWIDGDKCAEMYEKNKNIVANKNVRLLHFKKTVNYALDHCSVNKKFKSYSYFGTASYNMLKYKVQPFERLLCKICKEELKEMKFINPTDRPPPYVIGDKNKNMFSYNKKDWKKVSVNY